VRVLLIVNTAASSVTLRSRVVIQKALAADHDLEVAETSRRGHAERLAHSAALDGTDVVAVMGGDGTLNEAANGIIGSQTALFPLPGGSTNVFAQTIGVESQPIDATAQLLAALGRRSFRRIGVGNVEGRRFLFHVGLGFDAAVVAQVERKAALKRYASHPLFVTSAFLTWFRHYDRSRPRFSVELDDGEPVVGCYFGIVSKTDPYTFLGTRPISVAPDAGLETPLALTAFRTLSVGALIGAAASAMGSGRYIRRHPRISNRSAIHGMTVIGDGPFPYQVDGDYLGEADRLRIVYEPDALTIVMP
jgi:diacylglycerol kinase family enzyme